MTFQEAQIHALIIHDKAIEVEVIGMQVHDANIAGTGTGPYLTSDYNDLANQLRIIAHEIQLIAREGFL